MKSIFFAVFTLLITGQAFAQNDAKAIKKAIQTFHEGGANNDIRQLEPVLSEHFRVVFHDTVKPAVQVLDRATYLQLIDTKVFGGQPRDLVIESLDIHDGVNATAYVHQKGQENTLHTYLSLVKSNGTWKIVQDFVTMEVNNK